MAYTDDLARATDKPVKRTAEAAAGCLTEFAFCVGWVMIVMTIALALAHVYQRITT